MRNPPFRELETVLVEYDAIRRRVSLSPELGQEDFEAGVGLGTRGQGGVGGETGGMTKRKGGER